MSSTFSGLSAALSALHAQRRGLDIAGQNITNANTDGYTRQRVEMRAVSSGAPAVHAVGPAGGAGVMVDGVTRLRDTFLDARQRTQHADNSYVADRQRIFGEVEMRLTEPSDTGIQAQLGDLWAAWHDVANNPGDVGARTQLLQQAATVAGSLGAAHSGLDSLWTTTRTQLDGLVTEVNSAAARVAEFNQAIVRAQAGGLPANELADQRDQLVLRLAELTGASAVRRDDGSTDVLLDGSALVSGSTARGLELAGAGRLADVGADPVALRWQDSGERAAVPSGQIASALEGLGSTLPYYAGQLDGVAAALATGVNAQHAAGYDLAGTAGGAFFTGTTATTIAVAITDPARIAAAATPGPPHPVTGLPTGTLDGGNATAVGGLVASPTGADRTYRQLVAALGATAQTANQRAAIQSALTSDADAAVLGESGVSLDEEMTNLLSYQRAYEAAARLMTVVDSTLDTLINSIGR